MSPLPRLSNEVRSLKQILVSWFLRFVVMCCIGTATLFSKINRARKEERGRNVMLATARFYSDNWILTHIIPIARSGVVDKIIVVTTSRIPDIAGIDSAIPGPWLCRLFGETNARLITFVRLSIAVRPKFIAGFHLLLNGLVAMMMAAIVGARSIYFCGGGPRELEGGGYATQNALFSKLDQPDLALENLLLRAVKRMDYTIVMGANAASYFAERGVGGKICVLPGGIDENEFYPGDSAGDIDIVSVGRISDVKRFDRFVRMISLLKKDNQDVSSAIVGDGPDRANIEALAQELGVSENVRFVGWTNDVAHWLRRSRVFAMTSDSEGLSQALIQAQLCGLPSVVSDVGDLRDIVEDGINGYLIGQLTPEGFARAIGPILEDKELHARMTQSALDVSTRYSVASASLQWATLLKSPLS